MPDVILKHVPGMAAAKPVPTLDAAGLSEDTFIKDHVAHSRPCVIKGAVNHWPATKKWGDADYLKRVRNHPVSYWPHERHVAPKKMTAGRTMAFAEAVDLMQTADVAAFHTQTPPELASDLAGFPFLTRPEKPFFYSSDRIIFFRSAGTAWHYHPWDETLMCQVKGPKKIGLLDVRNPLHRHVRHIFLKEDYYDHAFAFNALATEGLSWFSADLETGDALYIPPHWWHGIIATSDEIGVTVPVTWKSPLHVIVNTITGMARGEIDLIGVIPADHIQSLFDFARGAGVEDHLKMALERCLREQLMVVGEPLHQPIY